jgi:hypothetical protein
MHTPFPRWVKNRGSGGPAPVIHSPQYPIKQTIQPRTSLALECQLRPNAVQQEVPLFDHLVGKQLHRDRHFYAQRLGGLEIDHKLELRWL